jgi:hypothetical protein
MNQTNISVINFPEFIIKNSKKKDLELLGDFKLHLAYTIIEFSNNYLNLYDELINKCNIFIEKCYPCLIKIKFYLSLLEIKDKNQTNKYEYEKCTHIATIIDFNNLNHLIKKIYEIMNYDLEIDNHKIIDIANIHGKDENVFLNSLIIKYENNTEKQFNNNHNQIIIQFNNIINFILLEIINVNEIITGINITSNNW